MTDRSIPRPTDKLTQTSLSDILHIALSHCGAALAERGLPLSAADTRELAGSLATDASHNKSDALARLLAQLVDENLSLIRRRWGLDYATLLRADINDIGDWESTSDFIDLANDKADAETTIALGSALLLAAGQRQYGVYLIDAVEYEAGELDIDARIAKRMLLHAADVDAAQEDWLAQVKRWLATPSSCS